eukprot:230787_1
MITPTQRATILINLSFSFAPHNIHLSKLTLSCFRSIYCLFILFHLIQFLSCFHSYHKGHSWSSPLSSELCMYLAEWQLILAVHPLLYFNYLIVKLTILLHHTLHHLFQCHISSYGLEPIDDN